MTVHDQCLQHPVSTVSEPSAFLSLVKVTFSLVLRLKYAKKGLLARFNCMLCTYRQRQSLTVSDKLQSLKTGSARRARG